ncbi:MAG: hypothetical protein Unbinned3696contig1008_27 [Prokaryotic dsDNA virus sp.]|nr:MAG: hypothetical protein Unbinned3696contig1008_27 [Prokaryotic dsDNA virus sp.]
MSWGENVFRSEGGAHSCNCIGPQNGDPVCPCQMRGVKIRDGRYVKEQDLGPVPRRPDASTIVNCGTCFAIMPAHANFCPSCGAPA